VTIAVLLPVRNGARDLPGWFDAVRPWADVVLALDDGSTDLTQDLLSAEPLVDVILANPPRPTAAGWDDGANRRQLLEAADGVQPDWIVWLDADERLAPDDGRALADFLATDGLPGIAYGLAHCRMWGPDRYDPAVRWVYRAFAWRPGLHLPDGRLHEPPVPIEIPRAAWVRTSIRLQHFGAADDDRVAGRLAKYEEADPEGTWPVDFGGLHVEPLRTVPWVPRDPEAPILLPPEGSLGIADRLADAGQGGAPADDERPRLVVLLPVRNGEADLPGWFASVEGLADAVVALDDGSTDDTRALLEAHPLVTRLLHRPRRPDHAGWDDAGNRAALLEAAATLRPRWILSLDADERIPPDDAAALRAFLAGGEAEAGVAYSFVVHRMVGDLEHYDRAELEVARLFAWEPGQRIEGDRLHLAPVPSSIPPGRFVPTSLRIQHLASLDEGRRRARRRKYAEADPLLEHQADYGHLVEAPGPRQRWTDRPADLPVLGRRRVSADDGATTDDDLDPDGPVLSAIVISRNDEDRIERTVRSVVGQEVPVPFEVIVVVSGEDRTAAIVRERFPEVHLIELDGVALPGRARNAGLAVARGDYASFPGSHVVLPPGSLAARIRAHERGYPMVTGTIRNLTTTRAGWASYFLDHGTVLPGRPSEELAVAPPHCSYDRQLLVAAGGFPEDLRAGEDTVANTELFRRGLKAWRDQDVELFHESPCRTVPTLVRHHLQRGRGFGRILLDRVAPGGRVLDDPGLVRDYRRRRLALLDRNVERYGDDELRTTFRRVRPLVRIGIIAAWVGLWVELLRPRRGRLRSLLGTPAIHVVLAGIDRRERFPVGRSDALVVLRAEPVNGRVALLLPPRDLVVGAVDDDPLRLNETYFEGAASAGGDDARLGLARLRAATAEVLDRPIHAGVTVDMAGFVDLVDALGGVEVDVQHEIDDDYVEDGERFTARFHPGPQTLDGEQALIYARTRMADGDRFRRERHAQLVRALALAGVRAVGRPSRWVAIGRAVRRAVTVEPGFGRLAVAALTVARRGGRVESVALVPPAVRSVRLERGWFHVADPEGLAEVVGERFVGGRRPADGVR
jgi:LCP family protein required for cell wall assembly